MRRHCSTSVDAPVIFLGSPPALHSAFATDQSREMRPQRAADSASSHDAPAGAPGWQIVLRFSAHTGAHVGSGHGGVPCVIEHGVVIDAAEPPGAASQRATTASVFMTPSQGSGTGDAPLGSALSTHDDSPMHADDAQAAAPAQSQEEL